MSFVAFLTHQFDEGLCFRAEKNVRKDVPDMMEGKLNWERRHLGSQPASD